MDENKCTCCSCARTTTRSPEQLKKLTNRLCRIEGQIRGIRGMLERDAYCPEILTQAAAARAALDAFSRELVSAHLRGCVASDLRDGKDETVDELVALLEKLMK